MNFLNIIIQNSNIQEGDQGALFPKEEDVAWGTTTTTIWELLVNLGCFQSKSQARKNWKGPASIPPGWSEFFIGKKQRHLCIWNPTE